MDFSELDNRYYSSLLKNYNKKEDLRKRYRDEYFAKMFTSYVKTDPSLYTISYENLFQELVALGCNVKKTPYGQGAHWILDNETYYLHVIGESLIIENLRNSVCSFEVGNCNISSLVRYLNCWKEICNDADKTFEKIVVLVDYRLEHASEEKLIDERIDDLKKKCRSKVQQEKDCEKLKEEFLELNREKHERLLIPEKIEKEEKKWMQSWNSMIEDFRLYWLQYRNKKALRLEVQKQEKEDAKFRELVTKEFSMHKVKPLYDSHYWIFYKYLSNGQALVFFDRLGNPKKIAQYGMKLFSLLEIIVDSLKKKVSVFTESEKKKNNIISDNDCDIFIVEFCRLLEKEKIQCFIEKLPRSYDVFLFYKGYGISFGISKKEYPSINKEFSVAIVDFLKLSSKVKISFDVRNLKLNNRV